MKLDIHEVKKFLPHRKPFLFIDSVERITTRVDLVTEPKDLVGSKVLANFFVRDNLEVLEGHFPGNPILPGVVQIEMMAQACAFSSLPLTIDKIDDFEVETLLLGVEKSRFRKQVIPNMKLEIYTEMTKVRSNIASYNCEIHHDGAKVSEATVMARLVIKEKNDK